MVASAPSCAGGEDGSISAFVADTVSVLDYTLDGAPASMDGNFLDLEAGEYLVEVMAVLPLGALCTDTASISVVDPPGMTISFDSIEGANPGEENGEVSVTDTGGEEPCRRVGFDRDGQRWVSDHRHGIRACGHC